MRSRLDCLFPDVASRVENRQTRQAVQHNNSRPLRSFKLNDTVYVRDFSSSAAKWLPGTVVKVTGPLSYHVQLSSGDVVRRHVDAVHSRHIPLQPARSQQAMDDTTENDIFLPNFPPTPVDPQPSSQVSIRRSARSRTAPDRYGY